MSSKAKRPQPRRAATPAAWLPGLLMVGGLLVLGVAAAALLWPSAPPAEIQVNGAPRLTVDREKVDLGDVPLGKTVSVTFELANVGDQPLRFKEPPYVTVAAGC